MNIIQTTGINKPMFPICIIIALFTFNNRKQQTCNAMRQNNGRCLIALTNIFHKRDILHWLQCSRIIHHVSTLASMVFETASNVTSAVQLTRPRGYGLSYSYCMGRVTLAQTSKYAYEMNYVHVIMTHMHFDYKL